MTHARRIACLLTTALAFGCSKDNGPKLTEAEVDADRQACSFQPKMKVADTMPVGTLTGKQMPRGRIGTIRR